MKNSVRLIRNILLSLLILLSAAVAGAVDTLSPPLVISELKVRNDSARYDEFIELYNATASDLFLNDYILEYFNATSPTPDQQPPKPPLVKAVVGDGLLAAGNFFVLAKNETQIPNAIKSPFSSSGLRDEGGRLRLTTVDGTVIDEVAWAGTPAAAIDPIVYVPASSSAKSIIRSTDGTGVPITEIATWSLGTPSPLSIALQAPPPPPEEISDPPPIETPPDTSTPPDPIVTPTVASTDDTTPTSNLLPLQISELLPNPGPPVSDEDGEFVELYNPNPEPIDLVDYKLQTGTNYSYSFTFTTQNIAANSYQAFYAPETNLTLANSAGRARLLDPSGQVIFETTAYEDANDDSSWILVGGTWQWTITPTPSALNVLTLNSPVAKAVKVSSKKVPAKKASTAAPKVKAASVVKTAKAKTSKTSSSTDDEPATISAVHPAVLAGVGGAALLYGLYEYRYDLGNLFYRLRRNRIIRRARRT